MYLNFREVYVCIIMVMDIALQGKDPTPWFSYYRWEYLRSLGVSELEFFEHPIACMSIIHTHIYYVHTNHITLHTHTHRTFTQTHIYIHIHHISHSHILTYKLHTSHIHISHTRYTYYR